MSPVSHNGVNAICTGRAAWDPTAGRSYRGIPIPRRFDPDDWSAVSRHKLYSWSRRVDARLDSHTPGSPAAQPTRP